MSKNSVSATRGSQLGQAIGYEQAHFYGGVTGISSFAISLSAVSFFGFVNFKSIPYALVLSGIGGGTSYFLSSYLSATSSSTKCKAIGEELAKQGKTEKEIIEHCSKVATYDGIKTGSIVGVGLTSLFFCV